MLRGLTGVSLRAKHAFSKKLVSPVRMVPSQLSFVRSLSIKEYNAAADQTLEDILSGYEFLNEDVPDIDVDLSQGVLTLVMPPAGTYVINKQPPNQQIWLSSPISGPKRYDLVDGKWVYGREQSTLGDLLREETLSTVQKPLDLDLD